MSNCLTRGEQTQLKLGRIAAQLLPMVLSDSQNAYAYSLHQRMTAKFGQDHASVSDVSRALGLLVQDKILVAGADTSNPRLAQPKVFYKPTWRATYHLELAEAAAQEKFPGKKAA